MHRRRRLLLFSLLVALGVGQTTFRPEIVRTVAPEKARDRKLEDAIQRETGDARYSFAYTYDRVNLDGGAEPEVLVYLHGGDYCGSGGCDSLVFAAHAGEYHLVSQISLTRAPIIVSSHRTNGWRDLIVFVSGGGIQPGYYAVLPFDGKTYPENPTTKPAMVLKNTVRGVAYLSGADKPEYVILVRPH